ncbi:thiamine phosphate synthase [Sphingomonas canadensis]|uniref:Thiamine phosphate synthase n=1 Tax=Sphingomonas canadensis TaxID=1219257 RepID=A0ABW3H141_9SPHN|nr:thiamine phosphate synthase [Sphingomonas canadensis]MCW3834909.1 thiamine phosphate synthase [Sphingomonas canadensis]
MQRRHPPLPRLWLMTDERMGERLWDVLERLPRGAGVIFRHYALPPAERRALFARVLRTARRRRLVLLRAGGMPMRGEMGTHGRRERSRGLRSFPAHDRREAIAAVRAGADLLLVSPVYPTRSHPGARTLGRVGLGQVIRETGTPVIALGGMNAANARGLRALNIHGWAAIDAWTGG